MTSRLSAVIAAAFVVLSFSCGAVVITADPTAAQPDCFRSCRF